jgi:hypothetical protein
MDDIDNDWYYDPPDEPEEDPEDLAGGILCIGHANPDADDMMEEE